MKIEEQVLSREQMAHLTELGVDTSDASMMWCYCNKKWYLQINHELSQGVANVMNSADLFVPTYTIGDLIYKVNNLFKGFSFTDNKHIDTLYDALSWMAENHKEFIK